jgi:hypothetical protein
MLGSINNPLLTHFTHLEVPSHQVDCFDPAALLLSKLEQNPAAAATVDKISTG